MYMFLHEEALWAYVIEKMFATVLPQTPCSVTCNIL